jgi:ferredoxin
MHIVIDPDRCDGHGLCEMAAPDLFELGDDDLSHVLVDPLPPELSEQARSAVQSCPKRAISIDEAPARAEPAGRTGEG